MDETSVAVSVERDKFRLFHGIADRDWRGDQLPGDRDRNILRQAGLLREDMGILRLMRLPPRIGQGNPLVKCSQQPTFLGQRGRGCDKKTVIRRQSGRVNNDMAFVSDRFQRDVGFPGGPGIDATCIQRRFWPVAGKRSAGPGRECRRLRSA